MPEALKDEVEPTEASKAAETGAGEERQFEVGETVVIREDFHSKSFRGVQGVIDGPARKGGVDLLLWPVKIDIPPHRLLMHAKYLRRPSERVAATATSPSPEAPAQGGGRSFITRLIPWRKK